jgi:hypothetical protein
MASEHRRRGRDRHIYSLFLTFIRRTITRRSSMPSSRRRLQRLHFELDFFFFIGRCIQRPRAASRPRQIPLMYSLMCKRTKRAAIAKADISILAPSRWNGTIKWYTRPSHHCIVFIQRNEVGRHYVGSAFIQFNKVTATAISFCSEPIKIINKNYWQMCISSSSLLLKRRYHRSVSIKLVNVIAQQSLPLRLNTILWLT